MNYAESLKITSRLSNPIYILIDKVLLTELKKTALKGDFFYNLNLKDYGVNSLGFYDAFHFMMNNYLWSWAHCCEVLEKRLREFGFNCHLASNKRSIYIMWE